MQAGDGYSELDMIYFNFLSGTAGETHVPPLRAALYQNYPNPFNPLTGIRFYLPRSGPVRLEIFDVAGRLVDRLVDGERSEGYHLVEWDARRCGGAAAASGIYFFVLTTQELSLSRKMVLTR